MASPGTRAPANVRTAQRSREIVDIQAIEHGGEVIVAALRQRMDTAYAMAAHALDAAAGTMGTGVVEVGLHQGARGAATIDAGEKQRGGAFQDLQRSALQQIGKTDVGDFLAPANGEGKAAVGVKLDLELRRSALAANAREDALKEGFAAGYDAGMEAQAAQFLRLTGGGAAFFLDFSASLSASWVPSMASSRFSL